MESGFNMGILSGDGQALLGSIFSAIYLSGRVYAQENVYDAYGDLQILETEYDCRLMVDAMTEAMRQQAGASEQDRRILVLTTSTSAPMNTDCEIEALEGAYAGTRFQIASIATDPCFSYWELRGKRAS